ncbi:hypothetical protein EYF80_054373 [Liparis tanakae]|uniref:Uncharacterized protein n=1 Tax=Liparis tanakae TaxID=230148 RepID=A0A4Z2F3I9_9TELE|nr:hypothetical protein EYF80_054373 [Liparis tanakae]
MDTLVAQHRSPTSAALHRVRKHIQDKCQAPVRVTGIKGVIFILESSSPAHAVETLGDDDPSADARSGVNFRTHPGEMRRCLLGTNPAGGAHIHTSAQSDSDVVISHLESSRRAAGGP